MALQFLDYFTELLSDGLDSVRIVRIGGSVPLEMWALAHQAAPFDIGLADKFLEKLLRFEDVTATIGQRGKRLIDAVEQHGASLQVAVQHTL